MTNLKSRIMKAVEFDERNAEEYGERWYSADEYIGTQPECFSAGARWQQARLQPLLAALADCAEALENAYVNDAYTDQGELAKLDAVLEGAND
jgi:hypothetical protein